MEYLSVILAGGFGSRMGNVEKPKQFLKIKNKPIIIHTISRFLFIKEISKVIIACHSEWVDFLNKEIENNFNSEDIKKIFICTGGNSRNESIINVIDFINKKWNYDDAVLVTHDGVRPFVSLDTILANINQYEPNVCVGTVVPATDTIIESNDSMIATKVPLRKLMFHGMTPQTFSMKTFKKLYSKISDDNFSDACGLFMHFNYKVKLVYGKKSNIKITTPYDLKIARAILDIDN